MNRAGVLAPQGLVVGAREFIPSRLRRSPRDWGVFMYIIYSPEHRMHAPISQLYGRGFAPAVEVPKRAECILQAMTQRQIGEVVGPRVYGVDVLHTVHDAGLLYFLSHVYDVWAASGQVHDWGLIPDTFAMRSFLDKPDNLVHQAGYYCFETQTPILEGTWLAAQQAAWCALTGADLLIEGKKSVYALCRPPGHHAGRDLYGGYCYLNNAALAAQKLSLHGRVTVLDVDYHHGNGTQAIFYASCGVQFVSLHADPNEVYPYYSGYAQERGEGEGEGFTQNFPLPIGTNDADYLDTLLRALDVIAGFDPVYLVVSLGVDILKEDPLSRFAVSRNIFGAIGQQITSFKCPTLFVQEGGYHLDVIGDCVADVLEGFGN